MGLTPHVQKMLDNSTARQIQADEDLSDAELLIWLIGFTEQYVDPDKMYTHLYDSEPIRL